MSRGWSACFLATALALVLVAGGARGAAQSAGALPMSLVEYIAFLDRISLAIATSTDNIESAPSPSVRDLPQILRVGTAQGTFQVRLGRVADDLRVWQRTHDAAAHRRLSGALAMLRSEAVAFAGPSPDVAAQRAQLGGILGRSEFRGVRGPSWIDRLKQRAFETMASLARLLLGESAFPVIGDAVVFALVVAAFVTVALVAARWLVRPSRGEADAPAFVPPPSREWPAWLADAHAAAAGGRWREAIRLCYWCAVSFLEAKGAWPPDRSRTPREYVRLLPEGANERSALALMTRRFESVWYGADDADAGSFAEALASLEKIGCPPA
jgi:hypothetical protein